MRLKTKITAALVPILLIQLIAALLPSTVIYQSYFKEQIQQHISDAVGQVQSAFDVHMMHLASDTLLFSRRHLLERYLRIENEALRFNVMHKTLLAEFSRFQDANPNYFEVSLVSPEGYEEVSQLRSTINNLTDEERETFYFEVFSKSTNDYDTLVGVNPDNGRWVLISGRKIYLRRNVDQVSRTARLAGLLIVKTDFEFLEKLITSSSLSEKSHVVLYHDDGQIIWHNSASASVAEPHLQWLQANKFPLSVESVSPQSPAEFSTVSIGKTTLIVGQHRLTNGLMLAVAWPESELTAIVSKMGVASIQLSLLFMTVSLVALYLLLNKILIRPILYLGSTAKGVGHGDMEWNAHLNSKDEIGDLACTIKEMGERLLEQKRTLHNIAYQDSLTLLPNRRQFLDQLDAHFNEERAPLTTVALLFIDLDGFKQVNDRCGHHAGDDLLKEVANRFRTVLRAHDVVGTGCLHNSNRDLARLGGDEFTVLLRQVNGRESIDPVAQRILACLEAPFLFDGHEFYMSASIGIAIGDSDSQSAVELLKNADAAMYSAKQSGKNTFHYFNRSSAQKSLKTLELKNELRKAIGNCDLTLAYQPKVSAQTGALVGMEALVRWKTPDKGWIRPDIFIPIAEEAGLICQLGRWVMLQACRQNRQWQLEGLPVVPVSVNVSNIQLAQEDMYQTVLECLKETALQPALMKFEVTESSIMQGEGSIRQLQRIREAGIPISLDDFGTGYSSLSALRGLPIDELKIDKSFIADLASGKDGRAIVSAIIAMAKQLHLEIVAEGVETAAELEFLRKNNVDTIQGYYFSKPLAAQAFKQTCLLSTTGLQPAIEPVGYHPVNNDDHVGSTMTHN